MLFLLFTFVGDMLVVHYQIEIQKLLKNCHPFWEAWGISCKYLSKDIELYCFSKETPKNGYIPPTFFKSLLFDILTQNPALICLTNSLLWKLHSHPSVLPICTNWTDDNIWGSKLCKLTKQILTCKHSYFFSFFLNLLLWQMSMTEEQAKDFLDSCTIVLAHQSILIWI